MGAMWALKAGRGKAGAAVIPAKAGIHDHRRCAASTRIVHGFRVESGMTDWADTIDTYLPASRHPGDTRAGAFRLHPLENSDEVHDRRFPDHRVAAGASRRSAARGASGLCQPADAAFAERHENEFDGRAPRRARPRPLSTVVPAKAGTHGHRPHRLPAAKSWMPGRARRPGFRTAARVKSSAFPARLADFPRAQA